MQIVQLTPGTGNFHCGTCLRDHAMVTALRKLGHATLMVPLYLPFVTDGAGAGADSPIFYGGVNVYLEQKSALFRHTPRWLDKLLNATWLLRWMSRFAGSTKATLLGDMTLSMLRGEEGRQAKELEKLIDWLAAQPAEQRPQAFCLSNAMLIGMARRLKQAFGAPVVCMLQAEDVFMDALPSPQREQAWSLAVERARDVDAFIAVSKYYGDVMKQRLRLRDDQLHVIHNGIDLAEFRAANEGVAKPTLSERGSDVRGTPAPTLGFLARMIPGKGLHLLVDAFIELKKRNRVPDLRLRLAGSKTQAEEKFIRQQQHKLAAAGLTDSVDWHFNITLAEKVCFLHTLDVLSVPTTYAESFGLYVLEAWAAGVPVVQPRTGAFPELIGMTNAGVLYEPGDQGSLVNALEILLLRSDDAKAMGQSGRKAVQEYFNVERMARQVADLYQELSR